MRALLICGMLLVPAFLSRAAAAQDNAEEKRAAALAALRLAVAARGDEAATNAKINTARQLQGEPNYDSELARVEEMVVYYQRIWEHFDNVCAMLPSGRELAIEGQPVVYVSYVNNVLTVNIAGQPKTYARKEIPAELVLGLVQQLMRPDDGGNNIHFGAFMALDGQGDRKAARRYFDTAKNAGLDPSRYLVELELPRPAEVPPMTGPLKVLLSEKNWNLRQQTNGRWQRLATSKSFAQNSDGRLVLKVPAIDQSPQQVVSKRAAGGDFTARLIVSTPSKDLLVGLFDSAGEDAGFSAPLTPGTYAIEIIRSQGKVQFRIGGKEVEATPIGTIKGRFAGAIGLQVPPGGEITIASVDFGGR